MSLWHAFQLGGWAMYPTFLIGLFATGAAGRFAWRGEHQLLGFVRWAVRASLAAGAFGFTVGMMRALGFSQRASDPQQMARIVLVGLSEAANNLAAALMFTVLVCTLVAVGERRFPLPNPSAVAR